MYLIILYISSCKLYPQISNAFVHKKKKKKKDCFLIAMYYSNYSESIYVFISLFFSIYQLKVWLQTKILCDLSAWSLAIPELCLAGPGGGESSCPPYADLVHCQGISFKDWSKL